MNWLDTILAVIAVVSMAFGFAGGIVRVVIGFLALVLAVVLSGLFHHQAALMLAGVVGDNKLAGLMGYLVVFLGVILIGALAVKIVQGVLELTGLRFIDRVLGAAFGLVRAALIGIVLVMIVTAFSTKSPPDSVVRSQAAPYLLDAGKLLMGLAPEEARKPFEENYAKVKRIWSAIAPKG